MPRDESVFVHGHALCESDAVGARTRVWAFAHVMDGAVVGADCNIGDHAFVESGAIVGNGVTVKNGVQIYDKVTVEDDVFLGPNMIFTNVLNPRSAFKVDAEDFSKTRICRGATIGANATVVCGTTVGPCAFVGAGAVVIRDVPAHAMMVGNPARQIGWMCACGERIDAPWHCQCGRRYRLVDASEGLAPVD